jgi:hypothetical protein
MLGRIGVLGLVAAIAWVDTTLADPPLPPDMMERTAASRAATQAFAGALLGELQAAMAAGGPVAAIEVCSVKAPEIARAQSAATGWTVGRTSLRIRNPANAPDAWERAQLMEFERRQAAGENLATMEVAAVVPADGRPVFRYMKAIPTAEPCLACHGSAVAPDIAARTADLYPEDQARGFAAGDLRGAFTITQPLP